MILTALISHYYGFHRGAKAAQDVLTLQLGIKAVDQMVLNSALLLSLKNKNSEMAINIAKHVEHDVKQLKKIEGMIEKTQVDTLDKNLFKISIVEAKENHKLLNDL